MSRDMALMYGTQSTPFSPEKGRIEQFFPSFPIEDNRSLLVKILEKLDKLESEVKKLKGQRFKKRKA